MAASDFSDEHRFLNLRTSLGTDKVLVLGYRAKELVSSLFEYSIDLACARGDLPKLDSIIGEKATLTINAQEDQASQFGAKRFVNGIINNISELGRLVITENQTEFDFVKLQITLVPCLWPLNLGSSFRIFQDKTIPDIIEIILKENGVAGFKTSFRATYKKVSYSVQFGESDFSYLSRLMESCGIYYYFEHSQENHTVVFCDEKSTHTYLPSTHNLPLITESQLSGRELGITKWRDQRTWTTSRYTSASYNFEAPNTELAGSLDTTVAIGEGGKTEIYDYFDGMTVRKDIDDVNKIRMEAIEAGSRRVLLGSKCTHLQAGFVFTLSNHYRADQNGDYLILGIEEECRNGGYGVFGIDNEVSFESSASCMSSKIQFREALKTKKPKVYGVQTATVVGPENEEIYTDKYGRIKVQFHWDREGQKNENSSCWMRVSQSVASNLFGAQFLPRTGQEVLVAFLNGDPDYPIVSGAIYNAQKMPPYPLPVNKTRSGLKTRSSKDGGVDNANELYFEDKKGEEEVYFQAEKDFLRQVKHDDQLVVGNDQNIEIKGNRTETVKEGDEKLTIEKGARTVSIESGDDSLTIGKGDRLIQIENGDQIDKVDKGNRMTTIGAGNDTLSITKGAQTTSILKDYKLEVKEGSYSLSLDKGSKTVTTFGNDTLKITKGNRVVNLDAGSYEVKLVKGDYSTTTDLGKIISKATGGIELSVGPNSIKIDQSGITLKGVNLTLDGSAAITLKSTGTVTVQGSMLQVNGEAMTEIKSSGVVTVQGALVTIG
ncbi:type VI secretion system tip protein VgrG [Burkholderiales bacterium]|nr:type VI secretion system tip protein VgrG [Burkholderiales bacterium]